MSVESYAMTQEVTNELTYTSNQFVSFAAEEALCGDCKQAKSQLSEQDYVRLIWVGRRRIVRNCIKIHCIFKFKMKLFIYFAIFPCISTGIFIQFLS